MSFGKLLRAGPGVTTIVMLRSRTGFATGLPSGSTSHARADPQGSSRTVTGPPAADLAERLTTAPSLRSGSRK